MRKHTLFACLIALACLAGCAGRRPQGPSPFSSDYRPPRDENFNGGPNALLLKYDANHDGSLTRAELSAGLKTEFEAHDTKHTGCLDSDQVSAINAARIAADQSTATPLQDWNQDGCIDLREFSTAATSLFFQLDANGDDVVTPQEFHPRGGGGPEGGGNRDGEGGRGPGGGRPNSGGGTGPAP